MTDTPTGLYVGRLWITPEDDEDTGERFVVLPFGVAIEPPPDDPD